MLHGSTNGSGFGCSRFFASEGGGTPLGVFGYKRFLFCGLRDTTACKRLILNGLCANTTASLSYGDFSPLFLQNWKSPRWIGGFFLISSSILWDRPKLTCHFYFFWNQPFGWFWGLTCDFAEEFAKTNYRSTNRGDGCGLRTEGNSPRTSDAEGFRFSRWRLG